MFEHVGRAEPGETCGSGEGIVESKGGAVDRGILHGDDFVAILIKQPKFWPEGIDDEGERSLKR